MASMHTPNEAPAISPRTFAFTLGPALLVLGAAATWKEEGALSTCLLTIGTLLLLLGVLAPSLLVPVARAWMAFGHLLGRITTPVIFTALWLIAFVPMGIIRRRVGRSPLARNPNAASYWVQRPVVADDVARAAMERQF